MSVIWGSGLSFAVIPKFNEWVRVMTTASDVSDSNWRRKIWKERAIASGFCETAYGSVPKSKVNLFLRDFFYLCVQIVCIAAAQKRY